MFYIRFHDKCISDKAENHRRVIGMFLKLINAAFIKSYINVCVPKIKITKHECKI